MGIGHEGSSKSHVETTLTIEIPSGGDSTPPTFGGVTGATDAATGGTVDLTWNAASDPSTPITYNIYVSTSTPVSTASAYTTSSSSTGDSVTGLTNGTPYYFLVQAEDSLGNESTNPEEAGPIAPTAPDTTPPTFGGVTGATDAGTGGTVDLTWNAATDPSTPITYNIYVSTSTPVSTASAYTTSSSGTGDSVTGLTDGTPYYFLVQAEDSFGNESTNPEEAGPITPTTLDTTPPSSTVTDPGVTLTGASYTITGDATDNVGVSSVDVSIDGGAWTAATITSGAGTTSATWEYNWTLPTDVDGSYNIKSQATDTASTPNVETPSAGITVTVDTIALAVDSTDPINGAPAAPLDGDYTIVFNDDVDCGTVNTATITSTDPNWSLVGGSCSGNTAVFTTSGQTYQTPYSVTVTTAVTDDAGNPMAAEEIFTFTTEPPTCSYNTPTVTIIDTVNQQITSDGGTATYTVEVTNNDSAVCTPTAFTLAASDTNSTDFISTSFTDNPLTVSPQSSAQTTMTVTAQVGGTNGNTNDTYFYTEEVLSPYHAQSANSITTVTTLINLPHSAATHYDIGEKIHFEFRTDTQFNNNGTGALTVTASNNTVIINGDDMFEVEDASKWIYTYDWDTTGQSAGYYQVEIYDDDNNPVVRAYIILDNPPNQINFFSDDKYTVPSDIFALSDIVYVEVKMSPIGASSITTSELNNWNGTTPPASTSNTPDTTGTTYRFNFPATAFTAAGINDMDWGYYTWEGDNGVILTKAIQRNDGGCGTCTYSDPTVLIVDSDQNILTDGGSVDYTIEVTNNDTPACGTTPFDLVATDTNTTDFNLTVFGTDPLPVSPGSTAQTVMTVSGVAGAPHNSTNQTNFSTALDANHGEVVNSTPVTTTIIDQTAPTFGGLDSATDAQTSGQVILAWSAATDVNGPITYNIYWATTPGGQNLGVPDATSTSGTGTTISGLTDGDTYYFVVQAEDSVGNESNNTAQEKWAIPTESIAPTFGLECGNR
jgi:hypothetical protein